MMISMAMLLDRLGKKYVLAIPDGYGNLANRIKSIHFCEDPVNKYEDDILYLFKDNPAPKGQNGVLPLNRMYIKSGLGFPKIDPSNEEDELILKSDFPTYVIIEEIFEIFLYYKIVFDNMISALAKDDALQSILELAADCLGNPTFVFDNDLKLLAYSHTYSLKDDPLNSSTLNAGFVDMVGEMSRVAQKYVEAFNHTDKAFIFSDIKLKYRFISKNIVLNQKSAGVFQIIETNRAITKGMLDIASEISSILSIETQRNDLLRSNLGILNGQFIIDLLENKVGTAKLLIHRMKELNWREFKNYYVMCIKSVSDFLTNSQLSKIRSQVMKTIPLGKEVVYDQKLIIIINNDNAISREDSNIKILLQLLEKEDLIAGLSQGTNSLIETPKLYKQSIKAIELGVKKFPDRHFYMYNDYILDVFFDDCSQNENLLEYCHPALKRLQEYDIKHKTQFMETLKQFTFNKNSQVKTANNLHIHRSTLLYRINKIEEIMGVNLEDSETFFHILLSLKLFEQST